FFSSRRRHTRLVSDWSSDVCSSDLSPSTFSNASGATLTDSGGTLNINATNWSNAGTLNIQAGTVNLGGTLPGLGTFNRTAGSVVNLTGTLNNTGGTLDIGGGPFGPGGLNAINSPGVIVGGTVLNSNASRTLNSSSGALDGVTLGSDLNLNGTLLVRNGLTLGDGFTFNIGNDTVAFQQPAAQHIATLGSSTISMAGGTLQAGNGLAQTLTIDPGGAVQGFGSISQSSASTIVNAGTIVANTTGQSLTINPSVFTNSGAVSVSAGTLTISPSTFSNASGATLTDSGGTLNINATNWSNAGTLNIQAGTVNLGGTLPGLGTFNRTAGSVVNLTRTRTHP